MYYSYLILIGILRSRNRYLRQTYEGDKDILAPHNLV